MKIKIRLFSMLVIIALFMSACNLPSSNPEDTASTAAAETVAAMLSATPAGGGVATASFTPLPIPFTMTPTPTILTNTPAATATTNCNVAQFITDVTIPDGTVVTPGQAFTKKWRIKNIGSCSWTGFSMVFDSGESMGGPASKPISTVNPGQEIDLEVNLTAPSSTGTYRGYWRINTNGNVLVPVVNGNQGKSFYVDIKVQNPATATPTPTPTNTSAPAVVFSVTNVTFNTTGTCPNFSYTYSVTANAAGTVNLHRVFSDGGTDTTPVTMTFGAAGTQTSPPIIVYMGVPATTTWVDIYIDSPNHQQFGRASFTCP